LGYGCVSAWLSVKYIWQNSELDEVAEMRVGVIGSRSFVGERLVTFLKEKNFQVVLFSRQGGDGTFPLKGAADEVPGQIELWVYVAPIWTLPEHFPLLEKYGARHLVAVSSTSRFTKITSNSPADRATAEMLKEGEEKVLRWADDLGVNAIILQSTLIYGYGKDKNVAQIARFIDRFGFFPLLGRGEGLRQPVHADDVALACVAALERGNLKSRTYILAGGEVLPYREMVERIFSALDRTPRFIRCPLFLFSLAVRIASLFSFQGVSAEMAVRMNNDHNFDYSDAAADLGFQPRAFHPERSDCIPAD
jgi:nucleoside-diphosphate-sugar epimerase